MLTTYLCTKQKVEYNLATKLQLLHISTSQSTVVWKQRRDWSESVTLKSNHSISARTADLQFFQCCIIYR